MLILMIAVSLIIAVAVSVLSSCYVCYNVAVDTDDAGSSLTAVSGIILLNALVPFTLGCLTTMWYLS